MTAPLPRERVEAHDKKCELVTLAIPQSICRCRERQLAAELEEAMSENARLNQHAVGVYKESRKAFVAVKQRAEAAERQLEEANRLREAAERQLAEKDAEISRMDGIARERVAALEHQLALYREKYGELE